MGWELVLSVQLYGRWFHPDFCGAFGGEKMIVSCFKDWERTVAELKSFFFKSHHWTTALHLNLLSFHEFLDLFSISS
jgi:hypothetical protein